MFWRSDVFECADLGTSWGIVGASSVPRGQQGALRALPRGLGVRFRRPWALLGAALGGLGGPKALLSLRFKGKLEKSRKMATQKAEISGQVRSILVEFGEPFWARQCQES